MENKNEYKGYSLFKDVEDAELRNRNRAVVMSNIADFNIKKRKMTTRGAALLAGYFKEIPDAEKKIVLEKFEQTMKERGFIHA